jgi:hypothetical protein
MEERVLAEIQAFYCHINQNYSHIPGAVFLAQATASLLPTLQNVAALGALPADGNPLANGRLVSATIRSYTGWNGYVDRTAAAVLETTGPLPERDEIALLQSLSHQRATQFSILGYFARQDFNGLFIVVNEGLCRVAQALDRNTTGAVAGHYPRDICDAAFRPTAFDHAQDALMASVAARTPVTPPIIAPVPVTPPVTEPPATEPPPGPVEPEHPPVVEEPRAPEVAPGTDADVAF